VRPGEQFLATVANELDHEITYGQAYGLERRTSEDGWEQVQGIPKLFLAIGYTAEADDVGRACITVSVPSAAQPGYYRVVADGLGPAGFQVAGRALEHPWWERVHALND
jgi:hypothetical protein